MQNWPRFEIANRNVTRRIAQWRSQVTTISHVGNCGFTGRRLLLVAKTPGPLNRVFLCPKSKRSFIMAQEANAATSGQSTSRQMLGLTGLTINAMALIAPGAFLWLTFQIQSLYGAPMAGS